MQWDRTVTSTAVHRQLWERNPRKVHGNPDKPCGASVTSPTQGCRSLRRAGSERCWCVPLGWLVLHPGQSFQTINAFEAIIICWQIMRGQPKRQHSPGWMPALPGPWPRQDLMSFSAHVSGGSGSRASANSSRKQQVPWVEVAGAGGEGRAPVPQREHGCISPARQEPGSARRGSRRLLPPGTWRNQPLTLSGDEKPPVIYVPFKCSPCFLISQTQDSGNAFGFFFSSAIG